MGVFATMPTSIRAVEHRGTNLQEVIDFVDDIKLLKANWGNGEVKVKTKYGWLTLPRGDGKYIVKGVDDDLFVIGRKTFARLFYDVEGPLA